MDTQAYLEQFKGLEYLIRAKQETLENNTAFFGSLSIADPSTASLVTSIQDEANRKVLDKIFSK